VILDFEFWIEGRTKAIDFGLVILDFGLEGDRFVQRGNALNYRVLRSRTHFQCLEKYGIIVLTSLPLGSLSGKAKAVIRTGNIPNSHSSLRSRFRMGKMFRDISKNFSSKPKLYSLN